MYTYNYKVNSFICSPIIQLKFNINAAFRAQDEDEEGAGTRGRRLATFFVSLHCCKQCCKSALVCLGLFFVLILCAKPTCPNSHFSKV